MRPPVSISSRMVLVASLLVLLAGCKDKSKPGLEGKQAPKDLPVSDLHFSDVTQTTGIDAIYTNDESAGHRSIVESLGGGVAVLDFDLDGSLDLLFAGGGQLVANKPPTGANTTLWRQSAPFRYSNVTNAATFSPPKMYSHGIAAADFDNDGFTDVLITGYGGLQLLCNQGDGTFIERTHAVGLDDDGWSTSAAWFDLEGDGDLDLYITHYVDWSWQNHPTCPASVAGLNDICSPNDFAPLPDLIYVNNGAGTFQPRTLEQGLESDGKGLGVVAAHLNQDNDIDLYVANDTRNNFLYLNTPHGRLQEVGLISGTAVDADGTPNGSMGLAVFDYDNNLTPDIWVTNYENETCALYQNTGDANFLWGTKRAGINALGKLFVSFGTVAGDFDCDGDEDLVVANGHIMLHPRNSNLAQEAILLENHLRNRHSEKNEGKFVRVSPPASNYFSEPHRGRGVVAADLDSDGDLDLAFSNVNEHAAILRNDSPSRGKNLSLRLVGRANNRDAIGSRLILHTTKSSYLRQVVGGGSYLSQNPYTVHFGIPAGERFESLEIIWPDGSTRIVDHLDPSEDPHLVIESIRSSAKMEEVSDVDE